MEEGKPDNLWEQVLSKLEEDGDIGDFVKGLEGEKPSGTYNTEPKQEQARTESSTPDVVTIEFYINDATGMLYSFAYEKRYSVEVRAHKPNMALHRRAGSGNFSNIHDLESFVKDYSGQLEHRGFRLDNPQEIEIGEENNKGLLFKHEYDLGSDLNKETRARVYREITGILKYLQERYNH